ncbi:lipase secretion chaperone [Metapseudomonas resinovorans]|uniref:Lipase chaperone n=1 Tax=Metapseudomonas resinovorans NBRC 106553 TaxID=1245471 RepID=S6AWU4_METRE|nr:lipase secretion chaperone [Pseudomonas resinovorans]BAN49041.1 lipase chaperone [Pseudomonas resinovorans NBRC 106553]
MKKLLLLIPIALAGVLAILLQTGGAPAPAASGGTPDTRTDEPPAPPATTPTGPTILHAPPSGAIAAKSRPPSLAGTEVDGRFHLDTAGNLLITEDIRRIFDYFLSTLGEVTLENSALQLRGHIAEQLQAPAESQALALLAQYLDYKRQLVQLERDLPLQADLNALGQREAAVQALRARIFSPEVHQAFFASDEAYNAFTLQRLAIQRDDNLDPAAKAAAVEQLRNNLPDALQAMAASQLQADLRAQVGALQAAGGSPEQVRQLRQQMVGAEATARLETLDRQRLQWQQRLQAYLNEKTRIEANDGLSDSDKAAAIGRLQEEGFNPQERLRLQAAADLAEARRKKP